LNQFQNLKNHYPEEKSQYLLLMIFIILYAIIKKKKMKNINIKNTKQNIILVFYQLQNKII
jgi:hypothetical protein